MIKVHFGGRRGRTLSLAESREHLVVRTRKRVRSRRAPLSRDARELLSQYEPELTFASAGVEVLRPRVERGARALRDRARRVLEREPEIQFAGRLLVDRVARKPVVYTENLFVKFGDRESTRTCRTLLARYRLKVKRDGELPFARNAYFVEAPEGTGLAVFEIANRLLDEPEVELCHPELARRKSRRSVYPGQWHLKAMSVDGASINAHANVEAAWAVTRGDGVTVAIIDDGIDVDHEEFRSPGKIVAPRDVTGRDADPRPGTGDDHGTAVAGVAVADGRFGASGVAPAARLMPIRHASALGTMPEADAFFWAAQHGADVISCSWGPEDGDWSDPDDPLHAAVVPLPDSTRLAIEYAATQGRNGKGCVILFAAGNGNESVDHDGYASHDMVIAVAACNDAGRRSAYSDYGDAVWCAFPSNDSVPARTPGIFTTDRTGHPGYNSGSALLGSTSGNYTNDFGGTSSAAPGAAGVAALILARNPHLRREEVKEILRRACDRAPLHGGAWNAQGRSPQFGYGRLNARRAVDLALSTAEPVTIHTTTRLTPIPDLGSARLLVPVTGTKPIKELKVSVDIEHSYVGDLVVQLRPPQGTGLGPVVLHNRAGGGANNLKKTYDVVNTPALKGLAGKSPQGTWRLEVADREKVDQGALKSVSIEMKS